MCIKLFYHGHKYGNIFVDYMILSGDTWVGAKNGETVCRFEDSRYDVLETDYGFEVNRVV